MTALKTFSLDHRKELSQITAWNHLLPSLVHDMPPSNTTLKLCHAVKCYSLFLDFTMLLVSSRAKVTTRKCARVIYIVTVVGICKCNTDWCHTPKHTRMHTLTALWYTDEYKDCSNVTTQHDGRKRKNLFHVAILIRTMQRSKAEAEKPRYTAAYTISSN